MANSLVGTPTTAAASNGADVTISMPTGVAQNDVCYVFVFVTHQTIGAAMSSAGWTTVAGPLNDGVSSRAACYRKVMGASPDANATVTGSGNTGDSAAVVCFAIRGSDTTTPEDATATTAFNGTGSTDPDPASIVTVTNGAWVIAFAGSRVNDASVTAPTGYSNLAQIVGNDETDDATSAGSTKEVATAGTEDPASYTTWDSGRWITVTVAVRPAAAASGKPTHFMHYQKLRRAA